MDRRQFVLGSSALALAQRLARGQGVRPFSADMPNMAVQSLARRLNEAALRIAKERAQIRTTSQALARNQLVRSKVRKMMGPFPAGVPLAPRTTRVIENPGYRIENVQFQSQPDYWIPANVYVPTATPGPFPAIVLQRGHFNAERMSADYQQMYFDLVSHGFVVLAFDPIGQGDRRQHYEPGAETFDETLSPTLEHGVIGALLSLIGESAAGYFVWDAMRAVDYLLTRRDVDRARIGCADHTDTGWSALYHAVLDERIQCLAMHVHGRAQRWPVDVSQWNITDDAEQQLFPAAREGVDLLDILIALAPRPLLTLVEDQTGDFNEDAEQLRQRYRLAGATDKFAVEIARPDADWPRTLRLTTVSWFQRWLLHKTNEITETDVKTQPAGALRQPAIGRSIYSIIGTHASMLPPPAADATSQRDEIRRMLALPMSPVPLNPREVGSQRLEKYQLSRVEFLSEPGAYVAARLYRPHRPGAECVVHVTGDVTTPVSVSDDDPNEPAGGDDNDAAHEFADNLARDGFTVVLADVRGLGLTQPLALRRDLRGTYEHLHNSDVALANMAWALGDSLFAIRVRDLLRAIDFASQFGKVRLAGSDMGALWALFAAAVDQRVTRVAIQRGLASYRMLTDHGRFMQAASQIVPGILKRFDLPQLAGLVAPRPLAILDPTDHLKVVVDPRTAGQIYEPTRNKYRDLSAPDGFRLAFSEELASHIGRE